MSAVDVLLRGGTVITETSAMRADIAIAEGRIALIAPEIPGGAGEEVDCAGLHIFPGVIDGHLHFNEPGRTEWEGWASGSRALAAGGATACVEMPLNAHPPTIDAAAFDLKVAAASASSVVDFALWGGLVPGNVEQMAELVERGVIGFKAFMSASGIDDFAAADDLTLYEGMARAARLGSLIAVHAENDAITRELAARAQAQGRTGIRDYLASRPVVAELEAIQRAILFARETGCALHIVHVSSGRGVALVAEARALGVDVSCETCPHYLFFTEEDVERIGALAKCSPPIRTAAERDALWAALADGSLPMVTSDHSPAPASMKGDANFFQVWGGISGCQTLIQVLLTGGYHERGLPLARIARVTSYSVAQRFKLPGKGELAVGADADLAVVDLDASGDLQAEQLFYRHRQSPFVGQRLRGRVARTLLRGMTVYRDGQIIGLPRGRLVRAGDGPRRI
ncbi:MAG TPA: allantoinase [Ktedonobacterales bacterium]